jgi:hypothetical protein
MTIYYGKSADGSDMEEAPGVYGSPCGEFWSSTPFSRINPAPYSGPLNRRQRRKLKINTVYGKI